MTQDVDVRGPLKDPATLGWPPTLPIELALRSAPVKTVCEAYGLSREAWDELRHDPRFVAEVRAAHDMLRKEGMTFRAKAKLQAEELLKSMWTMIHDRDAPHAVRADLMKFVVKASGLSEEKVGPAQVGNALQINIQL
jgi:cytochrome P450